MKRILCLIENLGSGGAERQLTGLAVMLKKRGYQVEVCYYVKNEFYLPYLQENGIKSLCLSDAINFWKRFLLIRKYINAYQPDTVISYSASTSMITCFLKLLGANYHLIVSERNTTQKLNIRERVKFSLYRWANYIVPNSHSQGVFIAQNFPKFNHKIRIITNYVDIIKFSPTNIKCENDVIRMLCVGRLMPQKNIPLFIEAISKVVDNHYKIRVDWYGQDLRDAYSQECHGAIDLYHLHDVFQFHEPSSNIHELYPISDVFCLPSLYEGFPNVLCEAMSCGLPVLCSQVCDNPYIVNSGQNGFLFDPSDSTDIALTIERYLLLNHDEKRQMGCRSREIAVEMFSEDKFINRYLDII